ncbi:Indoleamine 2-3-dioxygenase [Penicillium cf. griseofulvum]|uniref:Indoleamine 2,3-dioxygenase n=1 Tax=Penicillium cf. griseofulvum TaxID=2972120 RepID=A0A9W9JNG1_9EURO|nr:Indoleamine 2-3-dioxygenase [Penicillium cf. griseofulvum]KAJ5423900.1 Indoleamine 2-3-dioxygenase [Penicillium cf. griseofulvum]
MARFGDLDLRQYGISAISGFLPEKKPLEKLPDPLYSPWESIVNGLPQLIKTDSLSDAIDNLPVLSTAKLRTDEEWRRAYLVLGFLSQGYIWSGKEPRKKLPLSIVSPLRSVSSHFKITPCATFATYCLWNTTLRDEEDRTNPSSYSAQITFTASHEEEWFYATSVAIEAQGAPLIPMALAAVDATTISDRKTVTSFLEALATCMDRICETLARLDERLSANFFYHKLRPFLRGSRNMASAGLPEGVLYSNCRCGEGEWVQFSGGSNAQSSLIHFFDIVLGIKQDCEFFKDMRDYMPGTHRAFLSLMMEISNIRDYVLSHCPDSAVCQAYNKAVAKLGAVRDTHIRVVARYILIPMEKGTSMPISAVPGLDRHTKIKPTGTGGTDIMKFLRASRDTTKSACCGTAQRPCLGVKEIILTKKDLVAVRETKAIYEGEDIGSH